MIGKRGILVLSAIFLLVLLISNVKSESLEECSVLGNCLPARIVSTNINITGQNVTAAGNNTWVQYNDNGQLGASERFVFDPTNQSMVVGIRNTNVLLGTNSFIFGKNLTASGVTAFACGIGSYATGSGSFACGLGNTEDNKNIASGDGSFAFGNDAVASGYTSLSIGHSTTASGETSVAIGEENIASGFLSLALGQFSTASGNNSIAIGEDVFATQMNSIAIGENFTNSQAHSIKLGIVNSSNTYIIVGENSVNASATDGAIFYGNTGWYFTDTNGNQIQMATNGYDGVIINSNQQPLQLKSLDYAVNITGRNITLNGNTTIGNTTFIGLVNFSTGFINNGTVTFRIADFNITSAGGGNSSWNQTFADTLYYGLLNPFNYYNSSSVYPNVTDYSLKVLNATALSGSNATNFTNWGTMSLWYNGKSQIMIDKGSTGINRWSLIVGSTINFFNPAPNTLSTQINYNTGVDDGYWHHIAISFNGTQARLFIDGNLSAVSGNAGLDAYTNNLQPVKIRNTGTLYSASIDELEFDSSVRYWNSNFTPSTYSTNTTSQYALFRFNEGNNVNATFDTGNIFNFTLNGTLTQGLRNWNNGVTKPVLLNTRTIEQEDATFATSALQNTKLGKYNDTSKGNIGAGEQLLYEDGGQSISASNVNSGTNMFINFHAWGTFNSTALNAKQVRVNLYKNFEGDDYNEELCSTGSHLLNGGAWDLKITETTGADAYTPTFICVFASSSALFNNVVYTRSTMTADLYPPSLQIYGTGVANNDVTFEGFTTEKWGSVA